MTADSHGDLSERAQQLIAELDNLVRQQEAARQAAAAEAERLRAVVADAATQLSAMLAGQRASRAALQAVIDALHAAVGTENPGES
jgi:hypothetical protein